MQQDELMEAKNGKGQPDAETLKPNAKAVLFHARTELLDWF